MTNQQNFTFIKTGKKLIKLNFDDILFVKGLGNYVELFARSNKKYIYYKSLKELIDKLPDEFMRVHNSSIVNLKNVEYIGKNGQVDHPIPAQIDHLFRLKLTTQFRSKLTTQFQLKLTTCFG